MQLKAVVQGCSPSLGCLGMPLFPGLAQEVNQSARMILLPRGKKSFVFWLWFLFLNRSLLQSGFKELWVLLKDSLPHQKQRKEIRAVSSHGAGCG